MMSILSVALVAAVNAGVAARQGTGEVAQFHVDCAKDHSLQRVLFKAGELQEADITLQGICEGHFVIEAGDLNLRGADADSGLAAPEGDTSFQPVLEVIDATVAIRDMVVRPATVGLVATGWNAELLVVNVVVEDLEGLDAVGVVARRGAEVHILESTFRDGDIGVLADDNATVNLQQVAVQNQETGVVIADESTAALSGTTIEHSREAGLGVQRHSDANVVGCTFRDNTQVHVHAGDWSRVTLVEVALGSDVDTTTYALGIDDQSRISSATTAAIYGSVALLDASLVTLRNIVIHGDVELREFSNAILSNAEVTGTLACLDGSNAICSGTTTGGAFGCPSASCGSPASSAAAAPRPVPTPPEIELPRIESAPRIRSRR